MSKIVVLLALYAAAVSTYLYMQSQNDQGTTATGSAPVADAGHPDLRKLMHEARLQMSAEVKERQRNIDLRLSRFDALQGRIEEGLKLVQETAENAADANYGKLETLEEAIRGFERTGAELKQLRAELAAFGKRLEVVEKRPPQIIKEVVTKGPAPAPGPAHKGTAPRKGPTLPAVEQKDPKIVAAEVAKARAGLRSEDLEVLFPAIEKIREHRVMDAVPRLIEILGTHKDEFGRAASAAALGKMQVADAVPALAEALVDKSELVAQQANKSLREITGFNTELSATAGMRKRRTARNKMKEWWRAHEDEVRARLGQPRAGGAGGG
ncbi:MAG: HEAT repeat domain-containing protein [Planctomycetota bacterium]|nr:HEAT repeat domain-containing protein [Planctomycetota bacterium]